MNAMTKLVLVPLMAMMILSLTGCEWKVYNMKTKEWETIDPHKTGKKETPEKTDGDEKTKKVENAEPDKKDPVKVEHKKEPVPVVEKSKPKHQGWDMSVRLDGKSTRPKHKEGDFQIWGVSACSSTPEIVFTADPGRLGLIDEKQVHLTIYPLKEGKENPRNFFRYVGIAKFMPGTSVKLNLFEHFTPDNKIRMNLKALPAGLYHFKLRVLGKDSWDQQIIELEIR